MAGVLDTARFRTFIAQELDVSDGKRDGDGAGRPRRHHGAAGAAEPAFRAFRSPNCWIRPRIDRLVQRARDGGAEIVKYLKTGSAYYAPSAAAVEMVESILKDKKKVLPCAAYLEGEYGIRDLFVGVPVKLGARGIEKIYEIRLQPTSRPPSKRAQVRHRN